MKPPIRILHLEDSPDDCEIVHRLLIQEGINCDVLRCDNREKFIKNLDENNFDLIFADCTLPNFSGLHALEISRMHAPETPFIFVSGTIGEELAIESLRSGATDYVLKDRLSRLIPAVTRAIAEADEKAKSLEMEQRLRQAQRLEAVGTLAGGVAHDFNNILTIIKGHISLLQMVAGEPEQVHEIAATIDHAAQRGSELVSQLLAFARKSDGTFTSTSINVRVREISAMLREAIPRNITFEFQLAENLPGIHADPGQVDRVLINLVTNARDAMPSGGKIIFTTSLVSTEQLPFRATEGTEQYLCLRVTDNGSGMDEATRQHIFEPFFTTKAKGKGTGLGMPVVYGLMQSHNGVVDVQSELGKGTSISLFFPTAKGSLPRASETRPQMAPQVNGTETILVVDDETDVNYFVGVILKAHGYSIFSATSAEQALEVLQNHPDKIHLIFSDIGLPKMDGFGLSREAKKACPEVKILLSSGYADGSIKTRMAELGIDGFLSKPYDSAVLLENLRTILDKK